MAASKGRPKKTIDEVLLTELLQRYIRGESVNKLSVLAGVTPPTFKKILLENGIDINTPKKPERRFVPGIIGIPKEEEPLVEYKEVRAQDNNTSSSGTSNGDDKERDESHREVYDEGNKPQGVTRKKIFNL